MLQEKKIDLHTHSVCSDGTVSPTALAGLAKKAGLSAIALTDHDTVDGLEEFLSAGTEFQIETISGIELATFHHGLEIHIVGLLIDPRSPALLSKLDFIKTAREIRNQKMAEKLTSIGLPVSYQELQKEASGDIITRGHFSRLMIKKNLASSRSEVFSKYISPGCPGYIERETLTPKDCFDTIHQAGGCAVLAHPTLYGLDYLQITQLCKELIPLGLDAMETIYSTFSKKQQKEISSIAKELSLKSSGGSDYHGANKPDIQLGIGMGNLCVPYSILENLRKK